MAKKTKDKKVVVEETPEIIPVETPWNNAFSPIKTIEADPNALSNYPYSINVPPTVNSPTTNPIANGGTGAPAIQQAPIVSGTQQVIDLYNTMKSMPAGTDVTMQNSQLMNGEEIQAAKDLNAKRQAEYDALVPTMIQSNKDSIQRYNDENQPKQTLPTPPPPPNGKPKSLADQYSEMMTMERQDSSGSFIDNVGAVRSVATPTIISAPPPVMKDIPPAQYATTTTSIRKPDPKVGGGQNTPPKRYRQKMMGLDNQGKVVIKELNNPGEYQSVAPEAAVGSAFAQSLGPNSKNIINSWMVPNVTITMKEWDDKTKSFVDKTVKTNDYALASYKDAVHTARSEYIKNGIITNPAAALTYDNNVLKVDKNMFIDYMAKRYKLSPAQYYKQTSKGFEPTPQYAEAINDINNTLGNLISLFWSKNDSNNRSSNFNPQIKSNFTYTGSDASNLEIPNMIENNSSLVKMQAMNSLNTLFPIPGSGGK